MYEISGINDEVMFKAEIWRWLSPINFIFSG